MEVGRFIVVGCLMLYQSWVHVLLMPSLLLLLLCSVANVLQVGEHS